MNTYPAEQFCIKCFTTILVIITCIVGSFLYLQMPLFEIFSAESLANLSTYVGRFFPADISSIFLKKIGKFVTYRGKGCPTCNDTGYKGRIGIYQVMPMVEDLKEMVLSGANTAEIKQESMRLGFKTMRQSALTKFEEGVTTLEEVLRCTVGDD